jgi:hypothetical protein
MMMSDGEKGGIDVVVLGAGFSKAVFEEMPLTNDLGKEAVERARARHGDEIRLPAVTFSTENSFESLLSLWSEDQPHLTEPENRANSARFAALSQAVAETLDEAQDVAFRRTAPAWLYELLTVFWLCETVVITLNYDTIVETAVETHWLEEQRHSKGATFLSLVRSHVLAADLLRDRPLVPPMADGGERPFIVPTMKLLKLHGSIDWWWVPGDMTGTSLAREGVYGQIGNPVRLTKAQREQQLPGRERFIVPPLATKTSYYRNPLTRQLWQEAYGAIQRAARVALLGYSLPVTDFVIAGMVRSGLGDRNVRLEVADLDPDGPAQRLAGLASSVEEPEISKFRGRSALELYAADRCDELGRRVVERLRTDSAQLGERSSVMVLWTTPGGSVPRTVFRASGPSEDGTVTVETGPLDDLSVPDPAPTGSYSGPDSLGRLLARAERIVAVEEGGRKGVVVEKRHGNRWLGLVPAGLFEGPKEATYRYR